MLEGLARVRLACGALAILATALAVAQSTPPAFVTPFVAGARLAGSGQYRWFTFHVYEAKLWVGAAGLDASAPDAAPFALDLQYARDFKGAAINKITLEEFERLQLGSKAQRQVWAENLRGIMPDVVAGEHLTGIFVPATGLRLYADGKLVGQVDDPEFAHAFFAIWLDPRTRDPVLRAALIAHAQALDSPHQAAAPPA